MERSAGEFVSFRRCSSSAVSINAGISLRFSLFVTVRGCGKEPSSNFPGKVRGYLAYEAVVRRAMRGRESSSRAWY